MAENYNIMEPVLTYGTVDDRDIFMLIQLVKKGISFPVFNSLSKKSPFTIDEWSDFLHLSRRTMQRYEKVKKTFDSIHSEKIIQITFLYKYGIEVFEDEQKFVNWLNAANIALGGIKPKELLDSTFGIDLLRDELIRLEHGVLA